MFKVTPGCLDASWRNCPDFKWNRLFLWLSLLMCKHNWLLSYRSSKNARGLERFFLLNIMGPTHCVVHDTKDAIFTKMRISQFCFLLWLSIDVNESKKVVEPNRTSGRCWLVNCFLKALEGNPIFSQIGGIPSKTNTQGVMKCQKNSKRSLFDHFWACCSALSTASWRPLEDFFSVMN